MKKWIISLFTISLISGCSTLPSTPKPHDEKYAIQVIEITIPTSSVLTTFEDLHQIPNSEINEYPIVYANIEKSAINDQTKAVLMPEDFQIIEGKAVAQNKSCKLGKSVKVSNLKVGDDSVSYSLDTYLKVLKAYDTIKLNDDIEVQMPYFTSRSITTDLNHKLNEWTNLGEGQESGLNSHFFVRVIPPQTN